MPWKIHTANVINALRELPENSVDACLTDPPYGLSEPPTPKELTEILNAWIAGEVYTPKGGGFMGKAWDAFVPGPEVWRELHRVLKPGAFAFVFAGSRTQDLMGLALRLAGFELRDTTAWLYGSGFPKSLNISAQIDKQLGAERQVIGEAECRPQFVGAGNGGFNKPPGEDGRPATYALTAPATPEAQAWEGYGTALKPGYEPAILVRKPLDGTHAENAMRWGVGGLNVDGARIAGDMSGNWGGNQVNIGIGYNGAEGVGYRTQQHDNRRWPVNVVIDPSIEAALNDVARYFYTAKPDREERDAGLAAAFPIAQGANTSALRDGKRSGGEMTGRKDGSAGLNSPRAGAGRLGGRYNVHPTVKPISLAQYLATLLLPPARHGEPRRIVVPFSGSGSEMIGALLAGWESIVGIERESEYAAIADARLRHWASIDTPPDRKEDGQLSIFGIGA